MKCKNNKIIVYSVIVLILLLSSIHIYRNYYNYRNYYYHYKNYYLRIENFETRDENIKVFYINLDKNKKRNYDFIGSYYASDIKELELKRFPAIVGTSVDIKQWLTSEALDELKETELTKERTHHYQLTYGGVGCFLSHYTLAKQLLNDSDTEYYIICEDDIGFYKKTIESINYYLSKAPEDWDMVHFTTLRKINYTTNGVFCKPNGFWGMECYIINKKGSQKLIDEVQKEKIDAQIDAYLSRMIQQNKINIYITNTKLIEKSPNSNITDIQYKLQRSLSKVNPYNYKGYIV